MHASRQRHSDSMAEIQEEEKMTNMYCNKIIIHNLYTHIIHKLPFCCINIFKGVAQIYSCITSRCSDVETECNKMHSSVLCLMSRLFTVNTMISVDNYCKVRRGNLEHFLSCCKEDSTEFLENLLVAKVHLWSATGNRKLMSLLHLLGERGPNRAACEN